VGQSFWADFTNKGVWFGRRYQGNSRLFLFSVSSTALVRMIPNWKFNCCSQSIFFFMYGWLVMHSVFCSVLGFVLRSSVLFSTLTISTTSLLRLERAGNFYDPITARLIDSTSSLWSEVVWVL